MPLVMLVLSVAVSAVLEELVVPVVVMLMLVVLVI